MDQRRTSSVFLISILLLDLAKFLAHILAMKTTNIGDLKDNLSKFINFVEQGEVVEICKRNIPHCLAGSPPFQEHPKPNTAWLRLGNRPDKRRSDAASDPGRQLGHAAEMKLLLDTCCIIYAISEPSTISKEARALLTADKSEIYVSMISVAELACAVDAR